MPEQDNLQSAITHPKSEIGRRDFLGLAGQGALWATLGASIVALVRFLGFAEAQPPKVYTLDVPETYPRDTLTPVADGYAFIGHDGGGLYAINATCTHLGCLVQTAIPGFACPCHGSQFDGGGQVARGPATQPLVHAVLTLDADGRVVLDLGQTVDAGFRLLV